jgi:uncharacterized Zn finger protein
MERFNLEMLNVVEGKEKYHFEISNMFAALENLNTEMEIKCAWEMIRENIKMFAKESPGCNELKKHKLWLDEGWSKF